MKKLLLLITLSLVELYGANLHFSLFKKTTDAGPTLLVIGGIHGDEPGGYFAPAILKNHYKIEHGNLWIVPNLNFDSIVKNRRGIYNDMNRKFVFVDPEDEDYQIVQDIKELILNKQIDLVLNLHDGHGFYRKKHIDSLYNPQAWGQACIIDQQILPDVEFGNLCEIAQQVSKESNIDLVEDVHEFNVKNTYTKKQDQAMQQSLTYFAIQNNKPAFAIETSKNIHELDLKVYYQLKSIEEFMKIMGIKFTRDFQLSTDNINKILQDNGVLEFPNEQISLELNNLRGALNYFPLDKKLQYFSKNPLIALVEEQGYIKVMNGNLLITKLKPQFYEFDNSLKDIHMRVDGEQTLHQPGEVVDVMKSFEVYAKENYRVNIIGYTNPKSSEETGLTISQTEIAKRFSIDKEGNIFRVEFYKEKKFSGMIFIRYKRKENLCQIQQTNSLKIQEE